MSQLLHLIFRIFLLCLTSMHVWAAIVETNPVCQTRECQKLGDYYLSNLDQNVSPCNDFFDYVCHGWRTQRPKPKDYSTWTLPLQLEWMVLHKLSEIFQDPTKLTEPYEQQAKTIYDACMDIAHMPKLPQKNVKSHMMRVGYWPMFLPKSQDLRPDFPWISIHNRYLRDTGESAIFSFGVRGDPNDNYSFMTRIGSIYSAYGMVVRIDEWQKNSRQRAHYKSFLRKVVDHVAFVDPTPYTNMIDQDLDDVLDFRDTLENITLIVPSDKLDVITIAEFQTWYDNAVMRNATAKFDWLEVVKTMYENSNNPFVSGITNSTKVHPYKAYFLELIKLLGKTTPRVIVNHIHLFFAERHVQLLPEMEQELQLSCGDENFPNATIRYGLPREYKCILTINIKDVRAKIYVKNFFPDTKKDKIADYMEQAKYLQREMVAQSNWMSDPRILNIANTVNNITYDIGYPPDLMTRNSTAPPDPLSRDTLQANGFYAGRPYNYIFIGAAAMQPPVFTPNVPYVVDYGTTTSYIGHELFHGVSYAIRSTFRNVSPANGTDYDELINYNTVKQCIKDQYAQARIEEFNRRGIHLKYNQQNTEEEDGADVMGLKLAYELFRDKFDRSNGSCPILPGFEHLGCDKLFFIAYANTFCSIPEPGDAQIILIDTHNVASIRINGAVKNMKAFTSAFQCQPGDKLYAKKPCDILQIDPSMGNIRLTGQLLTAG